MKHKVLILGIILMLSISCGERKIIRVETPQIEVSSNEKILKRKVAIGRFSNETKYSKGLFYDKANDPIGKQALDILSSKLASSGKFLLLERNDLASLLEESKRNNEALNTIGADYLIIGSITEFGRKNIGKDGVFSTTKTQVVEAGVSIRLVEVSTGLIIYSDEAKGTANITTKTTMGLGNSADYDATLSDKAISSALSQLVENIINKCTDKPWRTYFLSYNDESILIAGGKSQGIQQGDSFILKKKGQKVKNPQTGLMIELPGKKIGLINVIGTGGDTPESEYSFVEVSTNEPIKKEDLTAYYIEELK